MKHGKAVWTEDDCTTNDPDHESLCAAWLRLFSHPLDYKRAVKEEDGGDGHSYLMPNGYIAWASYPGGSSIYEQSPEAMEATP